MKMNFQNKMKSALLFALTAITISGSAFSDESSKKEIYECRSATVGYIFSNIKVGKEILFKLNIDEKSILIEEMKTQKKEEFFYEKTILFGNQDDQKYHRFYNQSVGNRMVIVPVDKKTNKLIKDKSNNLFVISNGNIAGTNTFSCSEKFSRPSNLNE